MYIPPYVVVCLTALEDAGFSAYCVGGCVRDSLLGLAPHDYDLCTAATPEQIKAVFFRHRLILAGEKHGTVGVVTDEGIVEITTFRTEGTYHDNRHPDWVEFVDRIEEDLARRDFTVNAMAYSPIRGFADPFGGQQDLKDRCLRAVGDPQLRFREDSLRILRGIRFSVRYGLEPEKNTMSAMHDLIGLTDSLAKERVFSELNSLLPLMCFQDLLRYGPLLAHVIPELAPTIAFDQHSPHHAYDLFTHIAHVTAAVPAEPALRWAALLHDIGKIPTYTTDATGRGHFYGHAGASAEMAEQILLGLKAPALLCRQVTTLISQHMTALEPDKKLLRRRLGRLGIDTARQLLALQEADMSSKGTGLPQEMAQFPLIRTMIDEILAEDACFTVRDLAVSGHDLMDLGLQGRQIGQWLDTLLELVQNETVPNQKEALLTYIKSQI